MEIIPLTAERAAEAAALLADNYRALRAAVQSLPERHEDPGAAQQPIERALAGGLGFGATESGRLVGYLAGFRIPRFKGRAHGFLVPTFGHAASGGDAARVATYRRLYSVAAEEWLRAGLYAHAVQLPAPDAAARELFFRLGFGMIVIDAVRPLPGPSPIPGERPDGTEVRRASVEDAPLLLPLARGLLDHLASAPIFLPREEPTLDEQVEWLKGDDHALWLAFADGDPVGYIRCQPTPGDVAHYVQDPKTVSITGAFVRPEVRGRGVAAALLADLLDWATTRGYARCAVDCESANAEGSGFWLQHFDPVCCSLLRRVDERAGYRHDSPTTARG